MNRAHTPGQADLLDWQPPRPIVAYAECDVSAATPTGRIARAVATTLRDCTLPRDAVAQRMGEFLGRKVSLHVLNAYAAQGREEHVISADRMLALLHVTGDRRLLESLAERMGWAVIERTYLPLITLAAVTEREGELRRHAEVLRRQAKRGGLI